MRLHATRLRVVSGTRFFLEQSYLPDGAIDKDYLRWLYTAFTRAQNQVYLVGFAKQFFQGEMLD